MGPNSPRRDLGECFGQCILGVCRVVIHLQSNPEVLGHAEEAGKPQAGIGRDPARARDNLSNPALRHPDLLGQSVLRNALELTRFRGHLSLVSQGVHNAKVAQAVSAGIPAANG